MIRPSLIALSLCLATVVAAGATRVSWSKIAQPTEVASVQVKKPVVVKARVVYAGYANAAPEFSEAAVPNNVPTTTEATIALSKPSVEALPTALSAATAAVDLNLAAANELNAVGAGMIGRSIIKGRPYRSVDDLLTKRIVNRATFDIIKKQVTVRI